MNAMNIPGFTAEASLYKTSTNYQQISVGFTGSTDSVAPAFSLKLCCRPPRFGLPGGCTLCSFFSFCGCSGGLPFCSSRPVLL